MNSQVERRISEILARAERHRRCAIALDPADDAALRRRARAGILLVPYPGLYARPEFWRALDPPKQQLCIYRALAAQHPNWVFCSFSAALIHGLAVSYGLLERVHIATSPRAHSKGTNRLQRHLIPSCETVLVNGMNVTSIRQTVLDCLLAAPFADALAIADSALRVHQLDALDLGAYIAEAGKGRVGIARAREVAALANPKAESGGESIARAVMIEEGFAMPELQVVVRDPVDPGHTYRSDFCWRLNTRESRVARGLPPADMILGELDGFEKYRHTEMLGGDSFSSALVRERQRESRLTAYGIPIARFTYSDVRTPGRLAKILDAFGVPRAL